VGLISALGALRLFMALTHHGIGHLPTNILRTICVAEIAAAVFFLIPRTMRSGGVGLLVVYAAATAVHVLHGEYDISNLLLSSAAVMVVLTSS
ncbi:MAG TPA: hypothetical protein VFF42_00950, partial [Candidatus Eremiobacteraceae bacterium]|nr:hypothetical protein [Candidatus Eremiobacteraceae bacterium]